MSLKLMFNLRPLLFIVFLLDFHLFLSSIFLFLLDLFALFLQSTRPDEVILLAVLGPGVYFANEYQKQKKCFWGVELGQCVGLTTSPPSVSRLSGRCGILNI
jgi:hypothetical protein